VTVDPAMVHAVVASLADRDIADFDAAMSAASPDERLAAAMVLGQAARPTRSLPTANLHELRALAADARRKASALHAVADHFTQWPSWPFTPLSHWLKTCSPGEVAELRAVFANAGMELDA
jgi:hypothetical protein